MVYEAVDPYVPRIPVWEDLPDAADQTEAEEDMIVHAEDVNGWQAHLGKLTDGVNAAGAGVDTLASGAAVLQGSHAKGSMMVYNGTEWTTREDGGYGQYLTPDTTHATGGSWVPGAWLAALPQTATKGSIIVHDGSSWTAVQPYAGLIAGDSLIYDTDVSSAGVSWKSPSLNLHDRVAVIKPASPHWKGDGVTSYLTRNPSGGRNIAMTYLWQSTPALYSVMPKDTDIVFGVVPPNYRPSTPKTVTLSPSIYNISSGAANSAVGFLKVNGEFGVTTGSGAAGYWPNSALKTAEYACTMFFAWTP